jgi:hypothetical protein
MTHGVSEERAHPLHALSECLDALSSTTRELHRDPGNATTIRDYDFAIARIFQASCD